MDEAEQHNNYQVSDCPLDSTHDRLMEARYFLHRMNETYHDPAQFRYNTNAFLSALKSTTAIMNIELQRLGQLSWFKENKTYLQQERILAKFARGRDIVLHQRPLLNGSEITAGLFRGYKLKLASIMNVSHDRTSEDILKNILIPLESGPGRLIDIEHNALAEQLGVKRMYYVQELSEEHDVYTASLHAYARMTRFVAQAHEAVGLVSEGLTDEDVESHNDIEQLSVLLEGDIDPEAYQRWGWDE